jgi:hypothetical protein
MGGVEVNVASGKTSAACAATPRAVSPVIVDELGVAADFVPFVENDSNCGCITVGAEEIISSDADVTAGSVRGDPRELAFVDSEYGFSERG